MLMLLTCNVTLVCRNVQSKHFSHKYCDVYRCEVGTNHWIQCNDTPVKFARFPVTGLVEGRSFMFRVRAVNKSGMSRPSRVSEPVAAMDPADRARMRGTGVKHSRNSLLYVF